MSKLRVGFLGVGWIGRHRTAAALESGCIEATAICDPSAEMVREALQLAPDAQVVADLEAMLALGLDGVVIATPSGAHAEQSIRCLQAGAAVFCQKPLGRSAAEVEEVVTAARRADRLLLVDFSYRHTRAMQAIADLVRSGRLGRVFAIDLTFHNAYGPDKDWFYDRARSGGGCLMDLGSHLVDLAHWVLGSQTAAHAVAATLRHGGGSLATTSADVEDYAAASFGLDDVAVRLACSWRLHAGQEALIKAAFYGTRGGAEMRNVGGSFYDFEALMFNGTSSEVLVTPPDEWGGRAVVDWAQRAAKSLTFDGEADSYLVSARTLNRIYDEGMLRR
jgi:predicted dehydrogenase